MSPADTRGSLPMGKKSFWHGVYRDGISRFMKEYGIKQFYLTDINDLRMIDFYNRFAPRIKMRIVNKNAALSDLKDDAAMLYIKDEYPDDIRKVSILELRQGALEKTMERNILVMHTGDKWASVPMSYVGYQKFIEAFDSGFSSICCEDEFGKPIAVICRHMFRKFFMSGNFPRCTDLFLEYTDDDASLHRSAFKLFEKSGAEELFALRDGYVASSVRLEAPVLELVRWNMISDEVAKEFFGENRRILLSSQCGSLEGFCRKFHWLDVTVFRDDLLAEYFSGDFDMLICGSEIWPLRSMTRTYLAEELFYSLLKETARRWLWENNVRFYYVDGSSAVPEIDFRLGEIERIWNWKPLEMDGYYVQADISCEDVHIEGNVRFTTDVPKHYAHTIFTIGPCITSGMKAKDDETIASCLQRLLNNAGIPYRMVNAIGAVGLGHKGLGHGPYLSSINQLYSLFHQPLRSGDIVLYFDGIPVNATAFPIPSENVIDLSLLFRRPELRFESLFEDEAPGHVSPYGDKLIAEFLFHNIQPNLSDDFRDKSVQTMIKTFPYDNGGENMLKGLEDYIEHVKRTASRHAMGKRRGCIVMNANPMTLGHQWLIEQALSEVDSLFVFIVQEDKSYFSFKDRFAIAKECCKKYNSAIVLPSGKFMISSLTFSEYFQKENLQGSVIMPARDIEIFAKYIVPALSIDVRFVGEEPTDNVTRQYNEMMKDRLPIHGIEVKEIPRLKKDGIVISASVVRELLNDNKWEEASKYLPRETNDYLKVLRSDK